MKCLNNIHLITVILRITQVYKKKTSSVYIYSSTIKITIIFILTFCFWSSPTVIYQMEINPGPRMLIAFIILVKLRRIIKQQQAYIKD